MVIYNCPKGEDKKTTSNKRKEVKKMLATKMRSELNYVKEFINHLNEQHYHAGDVITAGDHIIYFHGSYSDCCYDGPELASLAGAGVLEIVGRELVLWRERDSKVIDIEEMMHPNFRGTVYTRNVYRIKYDDFTEYLSSLVQ